MRAMQLIEDWVIEDREVSPAFADRLTGLKIARRAAHDDEKKDRFTFLSKLTKCRRLEKCGVLIWKDVVGGAESL